jgi:hypothetical protein
MAGSKSKNNPNARTKHKAHMYDGQKVVPAYYDGKHAGHGRFYAMSTEGANGQLIRDESGRPLPFSIVKVR